MKEAPIFVRAYDLHSWLVGRLAEVEAHPILQRTVLRHSEDLLDAVTLAVSRFDTDERLITADEHVALLRVHLRLACDKELLSDRQLLFANEALRDIGRQIGGWRKSLRGVE